MLVEILLMLSGCASPPPVRPEVAAWQRMESERAELRVAERGLMLDDLERALADRQWEAATRALLALEVLEPDRARRDRVVAALEPGGAPVLARLHQGLAEVLRSDPIASVEHSGHAARWHAQAEVERRLQQDPTAMRGRSGVNIEMVPAILTLMAERHVRPPAPEVMHRGGLNRLAVVATRPAMVSRHPTLRARTEAWSDGIPYRPMTADEVEGQVRSWVEQARADGIPEALIVGEWGEGAVAIADGNSRVIWPDEVASWEQHHTGITVGIGQRWEPVVDGVVAAAPQVDGPAWHAGLHQGDRFVALADAEGELRWEARAEGESPELWAEAVNLRVAGEPETAVRLDVLREGQPLRFEVTRAPVRARTVWPWDQDEQHVPRLEVAPGVGYIRIDAFRSFTDESVSALLASHAGLKALIVDLRNNAGGDVQAAANVADLFCAEGVAADLNTRLEPEPLQEGEVAWNRMLPGDPYEGLPLVVLTNRHTASGSELLAAALQHHAKATVIGEPTVGKGTSQELLMVESHGFALTLTTADWFTSRGEPVQWFAGQTRWGVQPDVVLESSAAETWQHNARRRRVEFPRTHKDGSQVSRPEVQTRAGLPLLSQDPAIARALVTLMPMLAGGE